MTAFEQQSTDDPTAGRTTTMRYVLLSTYSGKCWHVALEGGVMPFCNPNTRRWAHRLNVDHFPREGEIFNGKMVCKTCDHSMGR